MDARTLNKQWPAQISHVSGWSQNASSHGAWFVRASMYQNCVLRAVDPVCVGALYLFIEGDKMKCEVIQPRIEIRGEITKYCF